MKIIRMLETIQNHMKLYPSGKSWGAHHVGSPYYSVKLDALKLNSP